MQATYRSAGNQVDYTPGSAVEAGQVVVVSDLVGIATAPIAANKLGSLAVAGVFDFVKANEEIAAGADCYWDENGDPYGGTAGTGCVTTTSTANKYLGRALALAAATATTVRVLKYGPVAFTATTHETTSAEITDPGNAGAIHVTESGHVALVSAGAETRTLAAPTFAGQVLELYFKTRVGDIAITCATGVNTAANTVMTFNTAGDVVVLMAVESGANLRWRIIANDTVALS